MKSPFNTKSVMYKHQAEWNASTHLYSRGRTQLKQSCAAILDCRRIWDTRKKFNILHVPCTIVDNHSIELVKSYKYLGTIIDNNTFYLAENTDRL